MIINYYSYIMHLEETKDGGYRTQVMVELVLNGGHQRKMLEAHAGETPKTRNVETQGLVATKKA